MYRLYESREHFFLMNMSGPTYLMLHARIVPFLSSDYANASESYNSFPDVMPKPFFRLLRRKRIELIRTYRINIPLPC